MTHDDVGIAPKTFTVTLVDATAAKRSLHFYAHPQCPSMRVMQMIRLELDQNYFKSVSRAQLKSVDQSYRQNMSKSALERYFQALYTLAFKQDVDNEDEDVEEHTNKKKDKREDKKEKEKKEKKKKARDSQANKRKTRPLGTSHPVAMKDVGEDEHEQPRTSGTFTVPFVEIEDDSDDLTTDDKAGAEEEEESGVLESDGEEEDEDYEPPKKKRRF